MRPPEEAFVGEMRHGDMSWFSGGLLNAAWNAVDRHAVTSPERTALVWARAEGDLVSWSFRDLRQASSRMAQVLLSQGVRWGDRVVGHLPETPTLAMLHLGCARIGAVPVVVPARSGAALGRVLRATRARVLVTADEAPTPEGRIPLWDRVEDLLGGLGRVESVLVERRTGAAVSLVYGRDQELGTALLRARPTCALRPCDGEDPLLLVPGLEDGPPVVHGLAGFLLCSALGLREAAGVGPGAQVLCTEGFSGARVDVLWGTWVLGGALVFDERGDGAHRPRALGVTHLLGPRGALAAAGPGVLDTSLDGSDASVAPVWSPEGGGMLAVRFGDVGGTAALRGGPGPGGPGGAAGERHGRRGRAVHEALVARAAAEPRAGPRGLRLPAAGALSRPLPDGPALPGALGRQPRGDRAGRPSPRRTPSNVFPIEGPMGRA